MAKYLVLIGKTKTGYSAHCPDVLGCAATGETIEKTVKNFKRALKMHFEGMIEDGDAIPKPHSVEVCRELVNDPELDGYVLAHVCIDAVDHAIN